LARFTYPHAERLNARTRTTLRSAAPDAAAIRFPKIAVFFKPDFCAGTSRHSPGRSSHHRTFAGCKGEISGSESLYIDGKVEGTISLTDSRVTIGRNGTVAASISAREVIILGKVHGNIQVTDRLEIRSEGSLTGDVITQRISVEDGAILKGSVQVRAVEQKNSQAKPASAEPAKQLASEQPKAAAAVAGV